MPTRNTNSKTTNTGKGTSTGNKTGDGSSSANKKQGAVNVKVSTARERAKDLDEGRRMDANSNEL